MTRQQAWLLLLMSSGCAGSDPTMEERWQQLQPTRYVVQACEPGDGCVRAVVERGDARASQERERGAEEWVDMERPVNPIDELLAIVARGDDGECPIQRVRYADLGYPKCYWPSCSGYLTSPSPGIVCFEPDTTDIQRCNDPDSGCF